MRCEECEYRFKCFTLANNERPQRVVVNWKINNTCGKCKNAKFEIKVQRYKAIQLHVGFCDTARMLIHRDSAACEKFDPRKMSQVDKIYKEINGLLDLKNKKTKLPKYCVIE